ncbi:MAG: alpha/beta hydrolase, partial [Gammaproteobacteria bacterium]|nr:alpha/beta hydrolase [Gammaproteobacteria bacterium]
MIKSCFLGRDNRARHMTNLQRLGKRFFIKALMTIALLLGSGAMITSQPALASSSSFSQVNIGDASLHYLDKGKGEPVILVHGNTGSVHDWVDTVNILSKDYRVIAYSRRFSTPNNNPYQAPSSMLGQGVEDLHKLAQKLEIKRFHLVGLSWGGYISTLYAMRYQESLISLTLAEPAYLTLLKET